MPGSSPHEVPLRCDVAVVGAGIAGLTAAWHLRHRDVVVLEATARAGGRIRSENRGEYWLNLAAHVFPPPESDLGRLVDAVGLETVSVHGTGMGAYLNGRLVATGSPATYPLRLRTSTAGRLSLLRAGLKIRRGVAEFRRLAEPQPGETASARRSRLLGYRDGETFASFLGELHPDADELLRAAVNRVSAEPEDLSAGAGITQFAATFSGRASLYNRNLVGGTGVLVKTLEQALADKLVKNARVKRVANTDGGATLTVEHDGTDVEVSASAVVVATPAYVTRAIVDGLPEPLARALSSIRYGPYVVAALLTGESRPMPWDDLYAAVVGGCSFNMFFNTANVLRRNGGRKPGGSLMVYGSATRGARLLDLSDEAVADRFARELATVFPETNGIVKEVIVQRWEQGIPYSSPGRGLHQATLEQPLDRIFLAGDYLGERGGMDTAATSGVEAATAADALLDRQAEGGNDNGTARWTSLPRRTN
jgi:protoporphyrinogen/coproporphyrinogen III oxidase